MTGIEKFKQLENRLSKDNQTKIHAFRSGGGLRVLRLEDKDKNLLAYGEHPNFENSLIHLMDDLAAGQRIYEETYGEDKIYSHYLTGTSEANSNIDRWILIGRSFDIDYWSTHNKFYFKSEFSKDLKFKEVVDRVEFSRLSENFTVDGIKYECYPSHFPSGARCVGLKVLENQSGLDPWFRKVEITYENDSLAGLLGEVENKLNYWLRERSS